MPLSRHRPMMSATAWSRRRRSSQSSQSDHLDRVPHDLDRLGRTPRRNGDSPKTWIGEANPTEVLVRFSCRRKAFCLAAVHPRMLHVLARWGRSFVANRNVETRRDAMTIDGGTVIILLHLLVSAGVIAAFVVTFAGGLEWVADRLRERRRT